MGLIRKFLNLLYGSTSVEFESSFELNESITRLKAASGRTFLSALIRQRAVGTVRESYVSLRRDIPLFGNSCKPFFMGRFIERNERIVLVGRFTMWWYTKFFMSVWFGFCALSTLMTLASLPKMQSGKWWYPLFSVGMFCAGTGFVWFGKWVSRNDAAWLSEVIKHALSDKTPGNSMVGHTQSHT